MENTRKHYDIYFPTDLDLIDADNDNIDVLVRMENGKQYSFVVAAPDNLKSQMQKDHCPFLQPGLPFLFVERITEENIRRLMDALIEDEALLRLYGEDLK